MLIRADSLEQVNQMEWDHTWRIAMLMDSEYESMCGRGERGAYTLKLSRQKSSWPMRIGDLLSYAELENIHVILLLSQEELDEVKRCYQGRNCRETFLRPDEKKVMVHSTTLESWECIRREGCLKSWNLARKDGDLNEEKPIGHILGDPEDFRDYIMFGSGLSCEIVVASKQAGKMMFDPDAPYASGARLYLDAEKMAADGLLVRDGNHRKVKDRLPLEPYLLWTATGENLGLPDRTTTPAIFAQKADSMFEKLFSGSV